MKAMFTMGAIREFMESRINDAEAKMIEALEYAGEEFVNKARKTGNYTDDTGNLRSSIGYVILQDGEIVKQNFQTAGAGSDGQTGRMEAMDFVNELVPDYSKGFVLIGVAGMKYAAAVESLGYDVITGSAPDSENLKDLFGAIQL